MDIVEEIKVCAMDLSVPIMKDETRDVLLSCIRSFPCRKILEIGAGIGYSGTLMLRSLPEAFLTTIEIDAFSAEIAGRFFEKAGLAKRVRLIEGDVTEIITMMDARFDFIFLDGPKGQYEHLRPYLINLLDDGGVIFADNVLFKGYVSDYYIRHKHRTIVNSLRAFIDNMKNAEGFVSELLDTGDGIMISKKTAAISHE
ncbi:MAG: O-methyltransferase [Clostridiales bacterium]|jgi:predicted O-methyltransferase YrrM|nr:O-methyltransferase [Clostridiales bacterium]